MVVTKEHRSFLRKKTDSSPHSIKSNAFNRSYNSACSYREHLFLSCHQHKYHALYPRFWGLLMFGTFSIINIIVLLNLLIAMMNHSYQLISVSSVSVTRAVVTPLVQ